VFFDVQFHFARRGREHLRDLKKDTFTFGIDDRGLQYCEMKSNEKTKKHQTIIGPQSKPRMIETKTENCPIKTLKLYISKLDPEQDTFYCKPKKSKIFDPKKAETWYSTNVIGKNRLGSFMREISGRLNLSQPYTNHSIRTTVITLLVSSGVNAREIMNVTGHRCEWEPTSTKVIPCQPSISKDPVVPSPQREITLSKIETSEMLRDKITGSTN